MPFQFMYFLFFLILKPCKTIPALMWRDKFDWIVIILIIKITMVLHIVTLGRGGGR